MSDSDSPRTPLVRKVESRVYYIVVLTCSMRAHSSRAPVVLSATAAAPAKPAIQSAPNAM